jgi:putative membrane protein
MENSTQLPINVAINVSNATINKTGQSLDGPPVIRKLGNEPRNKSNYKFDIFRIHGSVIPTIMLPATLVTSWAVLWVSLFKLSPNQFKDIGIPPLLITLLSIVIGLLLVFRTNTAYDRYWEARKLWGTIFTHTRNLSRFFWITVKSSDKKELEEKYAALNLLMAYSISVKHYLRNEAGYHYEDLHNLLIHLPDFEPGVDHSKVNNLPMEISLHISSYISKYRSKGKRILIRLD